jgi:hypothetical protein
MNIGTLMTRLGVDASGLSTATLAVRKFTDTSKRQFASLRSSVFSIQTLMGTITSGLLVHEILQATTESEKAANQVQAVIRATGQAAGWSADQVLDLAASLQKTTTYEDEAIANASKLLLTFRNIKGTAFEEATKAVLDMAQVMGTDLSSSAIQVGKALNNPILGMAAMSRVGVQFDDSQKALIKSMVKAGNLAGAQGVILRELQHEFGGAAVAARDTFGGALEGLKNAFGDLMEAHGGLNDARMGIERLTAMLQDPEVASLADQFLSGFISSIPKIITSLQKLMVSVMSVIDTLRPVGRVIGEVLSNAWQMFKVLPPWAQAIGVVGAFLFGPMGAAAIIGALAAINVLRGKMSGPVTVQGAIERSSASLNQMIADTQKRLEAQQALMKSQPSGSDAFKQTSESVQQLQKDLGKLQDARDAALEREGADWGTRLQAIIDRANATAERLHGVPGKPLAMVGNGDAEAGAAAAAAAKQAKALQKAQEAAQKAQQSFQDFIKQVKDEAVSLTASADGHERQVPLLQAEAQAQGILNRALTAGEEAQLKAAVAERQHAQDLVSGRDLRLQARTAQEELNDSLAEYKRLLDAKALDPTSYQRLTEAARKAYDAQDEGVQLTKEVMTAQEKYNAALADYDRLRKSGDITSETYSRAVEKAKKDLLDQSDALSTFAEQAARNAQDAFAQFLFDPFSDGLSGMAQGMVETMRKISSQVIAAKIFESIGAESKLKGLLGVGSDATGAAGATAAAAANTQLAAGSTAATGALSALAAAATSATAALAAVSGGSAVSGASGIAGAFAGASGGAGGAAGGSSGGLFSMLANLFHDGGLVSQPYSSRLVSPALFQHAPRYHSGKAMGLRTGEVPAILRWNEDVVTRSDPRHSLNGGGQGSGLPEVKLQNVNLFDSQIVGDYISTPRGTQQVLNVVANNKRQLGL